MKINSPSEYFFKRILRVQTEDEN